MKRTPKLLSILLILIFCILNCNKDKNSIVNPNMINTLMLNDTLIIAYHDTLFNYEEHIWLSFDSLLEDSRCPLDGYCAWEGNAKLSFIFNSQRFSLNTYNSYTKDTTIYNYHIELLDVYPHPYGDSIYTINQYSAEIILKK